MNTWWLNNMLLNNWETTEEIEKHTETDKDKNTATQT